MIESYKPHSSPLSYAVKHKTTNLYLQETVFENNYKMSIAKLDITKVDFSKLNMRLGVGYKNECFQTYLSTF